MIKNMVLSGAVLAKFLLGQFTGLSAVAALVLFNAPAHSGEVAPTNADDANLCSVAIAQTERSARLPSALLHAIGMVESARLDPQTGHWAPWPWSINVAGIDHVYDSKREAIEAVKAAQASGIQSIDVGCMQINLKHHPLAFTTLDDAFDPGANVTYAAAFLWRLYNDLGNWPAAVGSYHSQTPELATGYVARVAAYWPPALGYVAAGSAPTLPNVDPYNVMTASFKARVVQAALDRAARQLSATKPDRLARLKFADATVGH